MEDYAILLDLERCLGCSACVIACQAGNELADEQHLITITEEIRGEGSALEGTFLHRRCFHCHDAACVAVCPTGALYKDHGLTAVNVDACSGCGYCVEACPYDIPKLVNGRVSKCSGCTSLIAEGGTPYCVQTCPSQALQIGPRDDMLSRAKTHTANHPTFVYGDVQLGGLGLLTVMRFTPESVGLPVAPRPTPTSVNLWQNVVKPASAGITGLALAVTAGAFAIARRNHQREIAELEAEAAPVVEAPAPNEPDPKPVVEIPPTGGDGRENRE